MLDDLKQWLRYEPETGTLFWLKSPRNGVPAGAVAGFLNEKGYRRVCVAGKYYRAHHLAWLFVHGAMPPRGMEIDHINGKRDDNRISNLRLATHAHNSRSHRTSGAAGTPYKGVVKKRKHWEAQIRVNYRQIYLGCFRTAEEAARAYDSAAKQHFGEFACLNFPQGVAP